MQDQIHAFIQRCGGRASSMAIAAHVLRLRNLTPAIAERVVGALLKAESRFVYDGVGNWHLARMNGARSQTKREQICLVFTPMRTTEIKPARRLVLGWQILPDKPQHLMEVALQSNAQPKEESGELETCSAAEFVQRCLPQLQTCALLAWNLSAALAALRRITANFSEAWLPPTRISLQNLSRNLLRLSSPPRLASVYKQLLNGSPASESWQDQMSAQAEIWEALQARCVEHGLQSCEQIAHYARRSPRADFSRYDFEEKDLERLPETPGVYVMKDRERRVIYVGKAANLRERVRSYFANALSEEAKLQQLRGRMARLHYEAHDTELDALLREQVLIKRFRPEFNRQVEVHEQAGTKPAPAPGIFLVPLRSPARRDAGKRVVVYFLFAHGLKKASVNLARIPQARIRKAVANYLDQLAANADTKERAQAEIARRWFQQNRAWISSLSPQAGSDADEVTTQLLNLLRAPEIFYERVELAR
jgi:hypothetical protein